MSKKPLQRPVARPNKKDNSPPKNRGGGGNKPRNNNRGGRGNGNKPPSPWFDAKREPTPNSQAGFVEYLRWMREPDSAYKDATKIQILQLAQENANYRDRLQKLNKRTELIAGEENIFKVRCPWRIRVGGHKGPENILLPAFDALGIPYLPGSSLRGVARTQAIREFMAQENISYKQAEAKIAPYFGSLEAEDSNKCGKVVFLDAYPLPSNTGGLNLDMANNIWQWNDKQKPEYTSNPNVFLSLEKSSFLIGLRLVSNCQDKEVLEKVREWLIAGLNGGVGSQINTGYGQLIAENTKSKTKNEFFRVQFALEGQLIHGSQKFSNIKQPYQKDRDGNLRTDRNGNLKPATSAVAEVRPTAFKSMLRYWFRVFCLRVLPAKETIHWESQLFGAITPQQKLGWVKVNILNGKLVQSEPRRNNDECGEQEGILSLSYSVAIPEERKQTVASLLKTLTWIMFNLGGIGQGARRPCYSRQNRQYAPWFRGSTFFVNAELDNPRSFWYAPESAREFRDLFQKKLRNFYSQLDKLSPDSNILSKVNSPLSFTNPTDNNWSDAADKHCQIVICSGAERNNKPFALSVLHSQELKAPNRKGQLDYDGNLCGSTNKPVRPSPVWIADLEDYQVVTIFGATVSPRFTYLKTLKDKADRGSYFTIFPL